MTDDLLAREKEFRRVNRELDQRSRQLFEEIDSVVNSQSTHVFSPGAFGSFRPQLPTAFDSFYAEPPLHVDYSREVEMIMQKDNECAASAEGQSIDGSKDALDSDFEELKSQKKNAAVVRFLKAKMKMIVCELQTMKEEYKKKSSSCRELEAETKKIKESKDKLYNQLTALKDTVAKLETSVSNYQAELQTNCAEKKTLKKEIDSLKKEVLGLQQQTNNLDLRLNRSLEENEKLKGTIKSNKTEEKELRNQIRKLQDDERQAIKVLERRNSEILQAFKKQSCLVDNLKKQKVYLEASKQIQLTREDFQKILDWKPDER